VQVEAIIGSMHLSLSRFRPFQARQALITTLRAQVYGEIFFYAYIYVNRYR
jgi:hypothetical protein